MENNKDFEEMRQQINLLKGKLDNQKIVNDTIIHRVVQEKMDAIHQVGWGVVIFGILEIPLVLWVFRVLCGFSWMFCIITALYVLATVIFQISMNLSLQRRVTSDDSLLALGQQLIKQKKRNVMQLFVVLPFTALWTGLLVWEAYVNQHVGALDFKLFVFIVIFGVALGVIIGLTVFFKRYNAMKDALSQIEMFLPKKSQLWQNRVNAAIDTIEEFGK